VWFTGCRPEEAIIIEPRHYEKENKRVVLPPDEAKGRKRTRHIYLPDEAAEILERNLRNTPVFVNTLGRPWDRGAISSTFHRIQMTMGMQRMEEDGTKVSEKEIKQVLPELSATRKRLGRVVRKSKDELRNEAKRKVMKRKAAEHAPKFCTYALRHSFANQSIAKAGLSLEETAAALGHTSTRMVYDVYGHLVESPDHMQKLVNRSAKARNGGS
jgi:integrase